MSFLDLEHLEKTFGDTRVVKDFNLNVAKGEFISLLGPSGCGKTTVLRMVAGFETPTSGAIRVDGKEITRLRANQRNVGMVFQSYALFPNLTVAQNVGFGLKVAGVPSRDRAARVQEMLDLIGLPDLGNRYPWQLSGGQQQRVALARALAPKPQMLLLDEPLSALDAKVRVSLRNQIREIQQQLGITTIFVTHDQEEAMAISDRIVVMHQGIADQIASPQEIYNSPATEFVASFVGTLNRLPAEVTDPAAGRVRVGDTEIALERNLPAGRVTLAARPEAFRLAPMGIPATVTGVEFLGALVSVAADVSGTPITFVVFNGADEPVPEIGANIHLQVAPSRLMVQKAA
ncbi:ABC transporter ATP-binding protein [Paracoccus aminophilus]|uniref:Putative spermidine/putrescine transport system, ATP-binding protein n=1 Tax=Paracoccus aminophilus JCM 7686 TaxID=1367847 RepID=S5XQG4_PARAH|nr:ATP-binding cassette domain-containing protein [Paracoccus aminophilus]AGT07297.1 putative spermidine/putrescine transport system, ATP-binding protein [Paracoccus aminophilus JCM 7686]